ncbi:MAG: hypothetical protein Kow0010_22640 [Dehalococcoidia bacterium]
MELVLGKSYAEINALLNTGEVSLALVCPKPYVLGHEDFGLKLLVAPVVDGQLTYYSLLIVPLESSVHSLADLEGASFAFSDPLSNSGHLAPTYQVALLAKDAEVFFHHTIFTYSHDNSIRAVADGIVDAAAVNSLIFDYMRALEPETTKRVRIVERWGPYGMNPIVVSPQLAADVQAQLRAVFVAMAEDTESSAILEGLSIDRFEVPSDSLYDSIREMRAYLRLRSNEP